MSAACHPTFQNKGLQQYVGTPLGALGNLDFKTGIPWPAEIPDDTSGLGVYGQYPLAFTRSQLANVWFTAKELTIHTPTGDHIVTVPNIFNETGVPLFGPEPRNPFKAVGGSFCFPLSYALYNDDAGDMGVNLFFKFQISHDVGPTVGGIELQADGSDRYYPLFQYRDSNAVDNFSTYVNSGDGAVGTLNFIGSDLTCEIRGTASYGDVTVEITDTW